MAIRTAADKISAKVEAFGKVKEGDYGPYQSVLFQGQGLPDGKLWRTFKPNEAKSFTKGQQVYLIPARRNNKDTWDVELVDTPVPSTPTHAPIQPQSTGQWLSDDQKRDIGRYVDGMGDLYAFCLQTAQKKAPKGSDSETIRCMASSLFIAAEKRFGLVNQD